MKLRPNKKIFYPILQKYFLSGIHYGHKPKFWNPKMAPYISSEKYGLHVFNLVKTYKLLKLTKNILQKNNYQNKDILIVGTSKTASKIVEEIAEQTKIFYINYRWLGGMLTNWHTFQKRIQLLKQLELEYGTGRFNDLSKKKFNKKQKMLEKLTRIFKGIKNMESLPKIVIFTSQLKEKLAIAECHKLGIPTICIVDSNCDPDLVTYPIPANDDSPRGIALILKNLLECSQNEVSKVNLIKNSLIKQTLFVKKNISFKETFTNLR